jgi:TrmH family RNA methyltransferase
VAEALLAGWPLEGLYFDSTDSHSRFRDLAERAVKRDVSINVLGEGVFKRVADAVTPQGVLAVAILRNASVADLPDWGFVVVCLDVGDPGNLGTTLRAAAASGAQGVVVCDGAVDVYNPKTVRASAGAIFHVPVVARVPAIEALRRLGDLGYNRVGTVARGGQPYDQVDFTGLTAVVLGGESRGIPPEAAGELDVSVSIPMQPRSESLNVAMAGTVLCFEVARQRRVVTGVANG